MTQPIRTTLLRGANPAVQLFDGDEVVALASVWRVDESPMGAGTALILWHAGRVRVVGVDPGLSSWLSGRFVRHFPEAAGLDWSQVEVRTEEVAVELEMSSGLVARAGGIEVRIDEPMGERRYETDAFGLDGAEHALTLRLVPCRRGTIAIDGQSIAGEPRVTEDAERPQSTAFLADDEVWSR